METYGGEQYVWVSKRKRISRAERAKYDAEGESTKGFALVADRQS
jgi:hypothetical protein